LKDWHFYRDTKAYYEGYTTPEYFSSDWLNEWWQSRTDVSNDYRFVYIGPKNSWTPLHSDVFGSFSWSANIVGKKKWIFLVPGEEDKLRDNLGNLAFDVDSIEESKKSTLNKIVMIQDEGEIIFVPSGWYHQVCNLEDTISINHNWFNGCNIETVYHNLILELRKVENEISDCKEENNVLDWNKLCQDVLRNSYGMNLVDLMNLLNYILKKRVQMLNCEEGEIKNSVIFDGYLLGRNHAQFDVIKVKEITLYLRSDFEKLIMLEESNICQNMIEQCDMFEFVE